MGTVLFSSQISGLPRVNSVTRPGPWGCQSRFVVVRGMSPSRMRQRDGSSSVSPSPLGRHWEQRFFLSSQLSGFPLPCVNSVIRTGPCGVFPCPLSIVSRESLLLRVFCCSAAHLLCCTVMSKVVPSLAQAPVGCSLAPSVHCQSGIVVVKGGRMSVLEGHAAKRSALDNSNSRLTINRWGNGTHPRGLCE